MIRGKQTRIVFSKEIEPHRAPNRLDRLALWISLVTSLLFLFQSIVMWKSLETPLQAVVYSERVQFCRDIQKKITQHSISLARYRNRQAISQEAVGKGYDVKLIKEYNTKSRYIYDDIVKYSVDISETIAGSEFIFDQPYREMIRRVSEASGEKIGLEFERDMFSEADLEEHVDAIRLILKEACK